MLIFQQKKDPRWNLRQKFVEKLAKFNMAKH